MDIGVGEKNPTISASFHNPGFLIRRLNQIHLALFAEEAWGCDVTPVQYSVLGAVARQDGRDQSSIAEEIGVDRATLASVAARLEKARLLRRAISRVDQRQKLLYLTAKGKTTLAKMQKYASRANERVLEPLTLPQQAQFLSLLAILVDGGNEHARAKLCLGQLAD